MACTVDFHMSKLFETLMEDGVLQKGGMVLVSTDGCRKQYKCSTAIYFMGHLSSKFGIIIYRAIGCPGHGKCEVDAINGVDKNTISRESM